MAKQAEKQGDVWVMIYASPDLAVARRKLSLHEMRTIIRIAQAACTPA